MLVGGGKLDRRQGRWTPHDRRERLEDVAGAGDQASALLQEIVGARRTRIERAPGDGKYLSSLLAGEAGRDQRSPRSTDCGGENPLPAARSLEIAR